MMRSKSSLFTTVHCRSLLLFALSAFLLAAPGRTLAEAVKITFDTDMSGDVDDAGALAILNALADKGEAELLACVVNGHDADKAAAAAVSVINTYYGRGDVPIGTYHGPHSPPSHSPYTAKLRDEFPHSAAADDKAPDAVAVYRHALAGAPDGSVVMVSVGFLSNLSDLLDSKADAISPLSGTDLVKQKVRRLVVMGGHFPNPGHHQEYNFSAGDVGPDTQHTIENWPTPILFSGFSIGQGITTGPGLKPTPKNNPVRRAYELYNNVLLHGRPSFDLTAALAAVRDPEKYWNVVSDGACTVNAKGINDWSATPHKGHSYLTPKLTNDEMAEVLHTLMAQPPTTKP